MKTMREFQSAALGIFPSDAYVNVECGIPRHPGHEGIGETEYKCSVILAGHNKPCNIGYGKTPEQAIEDAKNKVYPVVEPVQSDIELPIEEK